MLEVVALGQSFFFNYVHRFRYGVLFLRSFHWDIERRQGGFLGVLFLRYVRGSSFVSAVRRFQSRKLFRLLRCFSFRVFMVLFPVLSIGAGMFIPLGYFDACVKYRGRGNVTRVGNSTLEIYWSSIFRCLWGSIRCVEVYLFGFVRRRGEV